MKQMIAIVMALGVAWLSFDTVYAQTVSDLPEIAIEVIDDSVLVPVEEPNMSVLDAGDVGNQVAQFCCRYCCRGQPCGNSCISRSYRCNTPPGCACWGC